MEVVGWRWLGPADALARHRAGELVLPFPTQRILATLEPHRRVASLLEAARDVAVRPVRPRVVREAGRERILLPGEPGWF